jgi:PKD repeat protein
MTKENLMKKLGKKCLPYFMAGALAFGTLFNYRCADKDNFVKPILENPVAMLVAEPKEGDAPLKVNFDGSRSYARAPKSYLEKYLWDFDGDGSTDLTTSGVSGAWVDHVYEKAGSYDASLIVVDNGGRKSNKALENIVVNEKIVSLGQIAFWSNRDVPEGGYNEEIYSGEIIYRVKDDKIELTNIKRLTTDPGQDLEPAWSPDGKEILFTSTRTGKITVWKMDADGKNQNPISSNFVERAYNADWGSNGKIIFRYIDSGFAGIGTIDPDENLFTPIYSEPISGHIPGWPKWSPDCSKIAFQKYINGNWEIFLMNADGSGLENLTNDFAVDQLPDWSADGNYIIFISDREGNLDIYKMNSNGNNVRTLTTDPGHEVDPSYSPDGNKIIFAHDLVTFFNPQLYLMNSDGSNWVQLTKEGANRYPAWRPKKEDKNFN